MSMIYRTQTLTALFVSDHKLAQTSHRTGLPKSRGFWCTLHHATSMSSGAHAPSIAHSPSHPVPLVCTGDCAAIETVHNQFSANCSAPTHSCASAFLLNMRSLHVGGCKSDTLFIHNAVLQHGGSGGAGGQCYTGAPPCAGPAPNATLPPAPDSGVTRISCAGRSNCCLPSRPSLHTAAYWSGISIRAESAKSASHLAAP